MREYGGWVYILTSKRSGTLCSGVTNDLMRASSSTKMARHRNSHAATA
jgi:predicted GIY-YIG superfamily endonuclease